MSKVRARSVRAVGRPGFPWYCLAVLSLGVHSWFVRSILFSRDYESGVEYLFVSAGFGTLAAGMVGAFFLISGAHVVIRWAAAGDVAQTALFARDDTAYLRPLCCFSLSALALANLVPGVGSLMTVWSYSIVDLRWWWTALVAAWVLVGIDCRLHGAPRRLLSRCRCPRNVRRWGPEAALVAIAATWVVAGTPHLRFSAITHGDEPKYLRYCEGLYQGEGFDISGIRAIADLPADFRPRVARNFELLADVLPGELRSLASDAVAFFSDPSRRFNRARESNKFLVGKNGGTYQVHQPGLSFLMFPAYYLDRQLGTVRPGSVAQWPDELHAVNAFFLFVYVAWAVLIFRFLQRLVQATLVAWMATLALVLTMPLAAFPFQFYPELAAGVLVLLVAGYAVAPPQHPGRPRLGRPFVYGLLAGYLPWLHVRFGGVAVVLAVAACLALRRDTRQASSFALGFAVALGCLGLYVYRITGSVMPSALWYSDGGGAVLSLAGAIRGSFGYLVDRDWGLLAHAPVYLLALPGYWLLARRRLDVACICALTFFALLLPAAGHTLHAAGTTPTRLIVAVVPLAAVPLAELLARFGSRRSLQIAFGLLLIPSLQNALAYNAHHLKHVGMMVDRNFSGWQTSLLFPIESRFPWEVSASNGGLAIMWFVVLLTLLGAPGLFHLAQARGWFVANPWSDRRSLGGGTAVVVAAASLCVLGTTVSAATGVWWNGRYRVPADVSAWEAAELVDENGGCAICASSLLGPIGTSVLAAKLEGVAPGLSERRSATVRADRGSYGGWLLMPGLVRAWYVEANEREPTGRDIGHYLYAWREEAVSPEEVRRRIFAEAASSVGVESGLEPVASENTP